MPHLTPRWVLQYWGTEVCRNGFHDDIWIASLENKLRNSQDNVVISDCRFPNEIKSLRAAGGIIVCVERGVQPHWTDIAVKANSGDTKAQAWLKKEGIHTSETSWVGTDFDYVLYNNSSIDSLYEQIRNVINQAPTHLAAKASQTS
jgi:rhodanese-related sulfurtransferase